MPATYNMLHDSFEQMIANRSHFSSFIYLLKGEPDEVMRLRCNLEAYPVENGEDFLSARTLCALCSLIISDQKLTSYFDNILKCYNTEHTELLGVARLLASSNLLFADQLSFCMKEQASNPTYKARCHTAFLTILSILSKFEDLLTLGNFENLKSYHAIFDYQNGTHFFAPDDSQKDIDKIFSICKEHYPNIAEAREALDTFIFAKYPHLKISDNKGGQASALYQGLGVKPKCVQEEGHDKDPSNLSRKPNPLIQDFSSPAEEYSYNLSGKSC